MDELVQFRLEFHYYSGRGAGSSRPRHYVVYRNLEWHIGYYVPHQRRATIHDVAQYQEPMPNTSWAAAKKAAAERMNARFAD